MTFICYDLPGQAPSLRPAPVERDWMDATPERFAYRCLPLNIANACGWEVLSPRSFSAVWNGSKSTQSIMIVPQDGPQPEGLPVSHFGDGILTFHIPAVFRTDPGVSLFVTGPINRPKNGLSALTGVVETDWAHQSFTMNWKLTHPNLPVTFKAGEPICTLIPMSLDALEAETPVRRPIESNPDLHAAHTAWGASRSTFISDLRTPESEAKRQKWQKSYFRGEQPDGKTAPGHRTKLTLKPFQGRAND